MKIFITIPSFGVHGGIRVILEWANRLAERGHNVYLRLLRGPVVCNWFVINQNVNIVFDDSKIRQCDVLVVTSPHSVQWLRIVGPKRKFVFLQMMEHLFQPDCRHWQKQCLKLYQTPYPIITISRWGQSMLKQWHRGALHYTGNGVNFNHFPVVKTAKPKEPTVLVEGWVPTNPTKDIDRLGPQVAKALKDKGIRVLAYSAEPLQGPYSDVPDEYYRCPSLRVMNELYERAHVLIKASLYDFRSCAPVEAMTKGTVTARALCAGDDDLIHEYNALRGPYQFDSLYSDALSLFENEKLRKRLSDACYQHVEAHDWEHYMPQIESILCQS